MTFHKLLFLFLFIVFEGGDPIFIFSTLHMAVAENFNEHDGESTIGKSCTTSSDCPKASYALEETQGCFDNICLCKPGIEVVYDPNTLKVGCQEFSYSLDLVGSNCNATSCGPNEECKETQGTGTVWSSIVNSHCFCKEGYLRVGETCIKASHQSVLQPCRKKSKQEVLSCDLKEFSFCLHGRCVCFDTYFGNTTSGKCEPMKNYEEAYNLTEYRVKPNEYCIGNHHCISGLECRSMKCSCPSPCPYNSTEEICDCGVVTKSSEPPVGPTVLGIALGGSILVFWYYIIKKTIQKHTKKEEASSYDLARIAHSIASRPSTRNDSNSSDPVSPNTTSSGVPSPAVGFSLPSVNGGENQSPPAVNDINPGDNSFTNNPMSAKTSLSNPPPPYSGDLSSPYDSTSALPYPSNPTDSTLPYPATTSSAPYPISPDSSSPSTVPSNSMSTTDPPPYNPSYP